MYYTVDRIDVEFAVLENDNMDTSYVKLERLPDNIKEGDILKFENNIYIIDKERTKQTKKELQERLNRMFLN